MFAKAAWFVIAILVSKSSCEDDGTIETKQEDDGKRRVIIGFSKGMSEIARSSLFAMRDATIHHNFDDFNTMAVTLPADSITMLTEETFIDFIEEDSPMYPYQGSADESTPYGISMVQAPEAWAAGHNGTGIKVCIIDSGIDADHEDLVGIPMSGHSFTNEAWNIDTCDHGTHVAGTIAAQGNNDVGVVGVAPGVELIIMDVFEGSWFGCGGTETSTVVAAAQRCREEGADVINMSLGGGRPSTFAREAFAALRRQGILSIAAAGNGGGTSMNYPAGYESVVSVAAIDANRNRASFSQRNADVELAGPGVDVLSTTNGNRYEFFDGTSMASPHVTAVAALAWSSLPSASIEEVLLTLHQSAQDLGTTGRDNEFGYGLVQALDAISILPTVTAAPTISAAPTATPTTGAPTVTPPQNDLCEDAESLQVGIPRQGNTLDAGFDNVGTCRTSNTVGGVWFKVNGTGRELEANTCSNTNYDSKLSVFSGSCQNLVCVTGNDDSCGLRSRVNWEADPGTEYLILVHGYSSRRGYFEIIVTAGPTLAPTISAAPTATPPDNDVCANAEILRIDMPVRGTTFGAGRDDVSYCGVTITAGGVWYKVMGTGTSLQANTCSGTYYNSKLSVYEGDDCENLVCVGGNDNFCRSQSSVNWSSESGTQYFILVHGANQDQGDFELIVNTGAKHDLCEDADFMRINSAAQGNTLDAGHDNVGYCGTSNSIGGVWYKVIGHGGQLEANTCSGTTYDSKLSVFEGDDCDRLLCITGNDDACGLRSRVYWEAQAGVEYKILVHGYGSSRGSYELAVTTGPTNPPSISVAPSVAPTNPPTIEPTVSAAPTIIRPENDRCIDAEDLPLGVASGGNTIGAEYDSVGYCGTRNTAAGVWFKVTGNGALMEANTCSNTDYDTKISLFSGSCQNLACVIGNDDFCGLQSSVFWQSATDTEYLILVHGYSLYEGTFEIIVTGAETNVTPTNAPTSVARVDVDPTSSPTNAPSNEPTDTPTVSVAPSIAPPENDLCVDAESVVIGTAVAGTTIAAGFDDVGFCGTRNSGAGVWYKLVGNGAGLQANTCSNTVFNSKISVFEGGCDALVCVDGNDNFCGFQSAVSWQSEPGTEYWILVHGWASGTFELVVVTGPTNDLCQNAETLQVGTPTEGTTIAAGHDRIGYCGTSNTAGGVWYRVIGNGIGLQTNTCANTTYDSKISVFEGDCDNLVCIGGNNNWCGSQSSVEWQSETGAEYLILVHGYWRYQGDFEIIVINGATSPPTTTPTDIPTVSVAPSLAPPENDLCVDAESLQIGTAMVGTTIAAGNDGVSFCGTMNTAAGVWFRVIGNGGSLQANTCSNTDFNTKVSIFEGDCEALVCVGGNDNFCGLQSAVTWQSESGTEYLILVHGFREIQGNFELIVVTGPTNDLCNNAETLQIGTPASGTTMAAGRDGVGYCGTSNTAGGVWYHVVGNGLNLQANTCANTTYDTKISVFEGDCDNLVCLGGNNNFCGYQSSVEWQSEAGVVYAILVHGYWRYQGDFEIIVINGDNPGDFEVIINNGDTTTSPTGAPTQRPTIPATVSIDRVIASPEVDASDNTDQTNDTANSPFSLPGAINQITSRLAPLLRIEFLGPIVGLAVVASLFGA